MDTEARVRGWAGLLMRDQAQVVSRYWVIARYLVYLYLEVSPTSILVP